MKQKRSIIEWVFVLTGLISVMLDRLFNSTKPAPKIDNTDDIDLRPAPAEHAQRERDPRYIKNRENIHVKPHSHIPNIKKP